MGGHKRYSGKKEGGGSLIKVEKEKENLLFKLISKVIMTLRERSLLLLLKNPLFLAFIE